MSIDVASSCPPWCDPRAHMNHRNGDTLDHRTIGFTWQPGLPSSVEFSVSAAQLERSGPRPHRGEVFVHLNVEDLGQALPDGCPIRLRTDLSPEQAEILAAALIAESHRVRRLRAESAALAR
jgi:hypothetical protein